jgi:hypothetical protein
MVLRTSPACECMPDTPLPSSAVAEVADAYGSDETDALAGGGLGSADPEPGQDAVASHAVDASHFCLLQPIALLPTVVDRWCMDTLD